ncbi:MAG: FkbM family methyltransferase [Cyanobacteria bacterium P01_F01_bin.150]
MSNLLDRLLKRFFRLVPAARVFNELGLQTISRFASNYCSFVPDIVPFSVLDSQHKNLNLKIYSECGNDHIAGIIWRKGLDVYEKPLMRIMTSLFKHADLFVNVGANNGLYSIIAACINERMRVIAYEPYPRAIEFIKQNIALNKLHDRIELISCALSESPGESKLFVPEKRFGEVLETSASLNPEFRASHSEVINIQVSTLDDELRGIEADLPLMLVDVESMEHLVLMGGRRILNEIKPIISFELLREKSNAEALDKIRQEHGFLIYSLRPDCIQLEQEVRPILDSPNQIMLHPSRCNVFEQAISSLGLYLSS